METGNDSDKESLLMRGTEPTREKRRFIPCSYYLNIMETKWSCCFPHDETTVAVRQEQSGDTKYCDVPTRCEIQG